MAGGSATALSMHFQVSGHLLKSALDCEAEVFYQWFGNTREELAEEYDPYLDATVFLVVADRAGDVLGAVRLIAPGGVAGPKTLVDIGAPPWGVDGARVAAAIGLDLATTWEVATLGVRKTPQANRAQLSMALYHGLMTVAQVNRMTSFVAILDERVRRLLAAVGIVTYPLPGTSTQPYLGSEASTPVFCHFASMLQNQRLRFPDAYRLVTLGTGLDGVSVPPRMSFRLSRSGGGLAGVVDLTRLARERSGVA